MWCRFRLRFAAGRRCGLGANDSGSMIRTRSSSSHFQSAHAPLVQAAENVVPVAVTAGESVERLRQWADGRCLSAEQTGVYRNQMPQGTGRRKVSREPSAN